MPKYEVAITEVVEYIVPVEAKSRAKAADVAEQKIINTRNRDQWCVAVPERDCTGITLIRKKVGG